MLRRKTYTSLVAALLLAGAVAVGTSGCVLVPAPVPAPVVVAPRPAVVVAPPIYGYGWYGGWYGRWGHRW